jgi:hypothetical protein
MQRLRTAGYVLAVLGLFVAASSLVLFSKEQFPWTLFLGSFVYLFGAFMVFFGSRKDDPKTAMARLRFIRLGFVAVFALLVWKMVAN